MAHAWGRTAQGPPCCCVTCPFTLHCNPALHGACIPTETRLLCVHLRAGLPAELHVLQQFLVLGPATGTMTAALTALQLHFSQQNEDMQSLQTQRTELTEQLAAMKKAVEDRQAEVSSPCKAGCALWAVSCSRGPHVLWPASGDMQRSLCQSEMPVSLSLYPCSATPTQ